MVGGAYNRMMVALVILMLTLKRLQSHFDIAATALSSQSSSEVLEALTRYVKVYKQSIGSTSVCAANPAWWLYRL